jgi:CRISPR-associated protein Cas1
MPTPDDTAPSLSAPHADTDPAADLRAKPLPRAAASAPDPDPAPDPAADLRAKPLPRKLPVAEAPDLVPARMINEVLYCERLMYLEWVQGEWADNYFTADGKAVHRRTDREGQPLKPAEEVSDNEPLPYTARSVALSSEKLGITAKIDLVEVEGAQVVPIEYKRGKRPNVPGGAYLPERAQLCAQVLLLREHGYTCDHGEIYYAKDRQRHAIPIDDTLVAVTLGAVARARELSAEGVLPPPLVDSPKCHGCSLVGICLPDETRALDDEHVTARALAGDPLEVGDDPWGLAGDEHGSESLAENQANGQTEDQAEGQTQGQIEPEPRVRRLIPARDDKVPVYVQEQGSSIRLEGERLIIQRKDQPAVEARLANTSHVAVYGNVHVTTPVVRSLLQRGIPMHFFSYGGWHLGRTVAFDSKNVDLRLAHYAATQDRERCLKLARGFVASKILNSRTLLRRNHAPPAPPVPLSELKQLARKARHAESIESLLGIEGTAARVYFSEFTGMLKGEAAACSSFDLTGRNRRPPRDPINALLSFAYSLLTKELVLASTAVGLDPMLGFYHRPHFGRPGLALDLMEEFRPVIADSVVISALNTGVIQDSDFIRAAGAVSLATPARRRFILAFERRMDTLVTHPVFDYKISYRRVLEVQARLLSRLVLGEVKFYPEFRIR